MAPIPANVSPARRGQPRENPAAERGTCDIADKFGALVSLLPVSFRSSIPAPIEARMKKKIRRQQRVKWTAISCARLLLSALSLALVHSQHPAACLPSSLVSAAAPPTTHAVVPTRLRGLELVRRSRASDTARAPQAKPPVLLARLNRLREDHVVFLSVTNVGALPPIVFSIAPSAIGATKLRGTPPGETMFSAVG
ncbi:hypothetical protein MRX96_030079 [Rhipicephalus microplus]